MEPVCGTISLPEIVFTWGHAGSGLTLNKVFLSLTLTLGSRCCVAARSSKLFSLQGAHTGATAMNCG